MKVLARGKHLNAHCSISRNLQSRLLNRLKERNNVHEHSAMETYVRMPAVAGQFYPANADTLRLALQSYTNVNGEKLDALGCVVPHAGYMYSGHVAGAVYARLHLPDRY